MLFLFSYIEVKEFFGVVAEQIFPYFIVFLVENSSKSKSFLFFLNCKSYTSSTNIF